MKEKNLLNRILQNTACPTGFWGRIILRGMNRFHAPLAEWAGNGGMGACMECA